MRPEPDSIAGVLREAAARVDRVDARVLLCHVLGVGASYLVAHDDETLTESARARFDAMVDARVTGRPVAYLIGEREFYGRVFSVNESVLIPRPETELIVDLARQLYPAAPGRILDLGTGSGALAVTLACEWPSTGVVGVDASAAALDVARDNARRLDANVRWVKSDWFEALADDSRFDLIVSNPPYIRQGDPHLSQGDVRFEPLGALAAGRDGLDDVRRIVARAPEHLSIGGWLLMEHGYDQAADVRALMVRRGFAHVQSWRDLAGIERVTGGRLDAALPQA